MKPQNTNTRAHWRAFVKRIRASNERSDIVDVVNGCGVFLILSHSCSLQLYRTRIK